MLRLIIFALATLLLATPATAQFGGLKKKLQPKAGQEPAARQEKAGAPTGGTVVLTPDVVDHLITGLKAGQAERDAAPKEDTPYGRYEKAKAEYALAKSKCEAAQQTFPQRAAGNQKMLDRYTGYTEKMVAAQGKGDMKLSQVYGDSAMAMLDQSCLVKQPAQPDDYYEMQREIETRAEQQEVKASGMSQGELAMAKERATAILQSTTPAADASASETSAVTARASELKPLLGFAEPAAARATKPAPAPAPAPAAAPAAAPGSPQVSVETQAMSDCMTRNTMNHQAEIEALGKRAQAAQAAGDNARLMAIADTLRQIQMAGCQGQ